MKIALMWFIAAQRHGGAQGVIFEKRGTTSPLLYLRNLLRREMEKHVAFSAAQLPETVVVIASTLTPVEVVGILLP